MKNLIALLTLTVCASTHGLFSQTPSVCIEDEMSLRAGPDKTSKRLTTVSVGEEVTLTGRTSGEYVHVKLSGGDEGWTLGRAIVSPAKAGVLTHSASVYSRPSLVTSTGATLEPLTVLAVVQKNGEWLEVVECKVNRPSGAHIWLKDATVSFDSRDRALAVLVQRANSKTDLAEKDKLLAMIHSNSAIQSAPLYSILSSSKKVVSAGHIVPDANFREALRKYNIEFDDNHTITNPQVAVSVKELSISGREISSLQGIEAFTALQMLKCSENKLTTLDISANQALTGLTCSFNQLTSLDVSANKELTYLDCGRNQLTRLDVSANKALKVLICYSNQISLLDVSANIELVALSCSENRLTRLDVSGNTALKELKCKSNQLTGLAVSAGLEELFCSDNQLTSLDVSASKALRYLDCRGNRIPVVYTDGSVDNINKDDSTRIATRDGRSGWKRVKFPDGGDIRCFYTDSLTGRIFAGTRGSGIFMSVEHGAQWTSTSSGLSGMALNINCLAETGWGFYAGTDGGLYVSIDKGASWSPVSQTLENTSIQCMVSTSAGLFVGTQEAGVYHSADEGTTWRQLNKGLTQLDVSSLTPVGTGLAAGTMSGKVFRLQKLDAEWSEIAYFDGHVKVAVIGKNLFAGTKTRLFMTKNDGKNWDGWKIGPNPVSVHSVSVAGSVAVAATDNGVFLSTDKGSNWNQINSGLTNLHVWSVTVKGNLVFAGTWGGGVYVSPLDQIKWTQVNRGLTNARVQSLTMAHNFLFAGTEGNGIFMSTDDGETWIPTQKGLPTGRMDVRSLGWFGDIYAATNLGVFISTDYGRTWTRGMSKDVACLAVDGGSILAGTSQGMFVSTDRGLTWTKTQMTDAVQSVAMFGSLTAMIGGSGSVRRSDDGGTTWTSRRIDGNGLASSIDISGNHLLLAARECVFTSTDDGKKWHQAALFEPERTGSNALNPNEPKVERVLFDRMSMYGDRYAITSGKGVFLSADGVSWKTLNQNLTDLNVYSITSNRDFIFIGTSGGLWKLQRPGDGESPKME